MEHRATAITKQAAKRRSTAAGSKIKQANKTPPVQGKLRELTFKERRRATPVKTCPKSESGRESA